MSLSNGFLVSGGLENSDEFSEAIHALFGDGITQQGGKYELTLGGGFKVNISTGYAIANGRYIKHDEPFSLTFPASGNTGDRYDAVAARVDYPNRKAEITVLVSIDPENLVRNEAEYNLILYVLKVRRGATIFQHGDLQDVRDNPALCGSIASLSDISDKTEYIYKFVGSGIDEIVQKLLEKIDAAAKKADEDVAAMYEKIRDVSDVGEIGVLKTSRKPLGAGWLLCDGTEVPEAYPALKLLLTGGKLPNLSRMTDRYRTYIFAGAAAS